MKRKVILVFKLLLVFLVVSCGRSKVNQKDDNTIETVNKEVKAPSDNKIKASETIDLTNKGIGPIKSITLENEIDVELVQKGKDIFESDCSACHRVGKTYVGPKPDGILERRSPEWVMNMILNPEEMTRRDILAKNLLIEFNGAAMANQNITKDEARAVLEYFRTLK